MRENEAMASLEQELQKMYDSEIHVDIGWLWDGGINLSIGNDEANGNVKTVAEVLPWLEEAIARKLPESKYNVERMGGTFQPVWVNRSRRLTQEPHLGPTRSPSRLPQPLATTLSQSLTASRNSLASARITPARTREMNRSIASFRSAHS
jgi:hypothetical protein